MKTWKPTPTQARHIAINRALSNAGWLMPNSRKGMAVHVFDGGEQITFRFGDAVGDAILAGEVPSPTPRQDW